MSVFLINRIRNRVGIIPPGFMFYYIFFVHTIWKYSKYNPNGPKSGYLILKYIMNDKEKWSSTKGIGRD